MSNIYSMHFRGREVKGFQSIAAFDELARLIRDYEVKSVIELGAYVGMSTCWFAEKGLDVISIDHFHVESQEWDPYWERHQPSIPGQYLEFVRNTIAYPNIRGIVMDWDEAYQLDIEADMVYIDGVSPYYRRHVEEWMPKARKVICGDDAYTPEVLDAINSIGAERGHLQRVWYKPIDQ